jgi:excinuclease ABC subunit A
VIDLGPEGGEKGGYVIAEGTPEQLAGNPASSTGEFLREPLARAGRLPAKSNGAAPGRAKSSRSRSARVKVA